MELKFPTLKRLVSLTRFLSAWRPCGKVKGEVVASESQPDWLWLFMPLVGPVGRLCLKTASPREAQACTFKWLASLCCWLGFGAQITGTGLEVRIQRTTQHPQGPLPWEGCPGHQENGPLKRDSLNGLGKIGPDGYFVVVSFFFKLWQNICNTKFTV